MNRDLEIPFDRVTYRDGQLLAARDMEDDRRRDARLRQMHTRHQHDTWGIALGLGVQPTQDRRGVRLEPGYAVDGLGRDLLLAEAIQMSVPAVAGPESYVLILNYQEDAAFQQWSRIENVCLGSGLDPRLERPFLSWRRPDDVRFGPHVPVIQVVVENERIQGDLDDRVRRNARPWVRPHIGLGTTERGRSGWRDWIGADGEPLGLELAVDTSAAGFTKTPFYFVILHSDVAAETPAAGENLQKGARFLDGVRFVTNARQDGFTYHIIDTEQFLTDGSPSPVDAEERGWFLSWFGFEPVTGCEPAFIPQRLFFFSGFPAFPFFHVHFTTDGV